MVFTENHLRLKAYESGFCKKNSKFSPLMFLDSLFYNSSTNSTASLNQIAVNTRKKYKVSISKQGIAKRYTAGALKYVQSLIGEALTYQISQTIDIGWLKLFRRVLIKDSTKFDVSENLAKQFPGSGGSASKAGISIQHEFDIKSGEVTDLAITSANRPDTKDTLETIDKIKEGDLIIRDLGYSVLSCFKSIKKAGAYFLSRLNVNLVVYEMIANKFMEIDFGNLHQIMKEGSIQRLDKQVFIGKNEKFPVRLIIELMPDGIVNNRLQKVNAHNKKKGFQTSDKYKNRSQFNLFITNIEEKDIEAGAIVKIYKIRWQTELMFKAWKSTFSLDTINPMKYERLVCLLNVRLLLIFINWNIFMQKRTQLYTKTGKLLSINKCFKTLQENSTKLRDILINNCKELTKWVKMVTELLESQHWLEKKKHKLGLAEILLLKTL